MATILLGVTLLLRIIFRLLCEAKRKVIAKIKENLEVVFVIIRSKC